MSSANGYTRLSRVDLRGFDRRAQNLILMAMERGGEGRISNRGHAILRSPDKQQTMSVSRNTGMGNRAYQNMEADFKRCFGEYEPKQTRGSLALAPDPVPTPPVPAQRKMIPCPIDGCDAEYPTYGGWYSHVHAAHYPCKEPGCMRVFDTPGKASGHRNITHSREVAGVTEYPCDHPGCTFKGATKNGLGIHKAKIHKKPKAKPVRKRAVKKAAAPVVAHGRDLAAELDAANARIAALEDALARLREALR